MSLGSSRFFSRVVPHESPTFRYSDSMSELKSLFGDPEAADEGVPQIDEPVDLRPDLTALGIDEVEKGVCEDTFENRRALRYAKMGWDSVYSSTGVPTGLIRARSHESVKARRILSLAEKRPIMVDPDSHNSDYLTGLDLLAESATDWLVPPWVIGATKMWVRELDEPIASEKRKPTALPHRCRAIKDDGIRCMLWSTGRPKDDALCRVHLRSLRKQPGDDIERARAKLTQAAPFAVDVLEELMESAQSEPVRLKASTEILDRAGVRGGVEIDASVSVVDGRGAAEIIAERLRRLSGGALETASSLARDGTDVVDAEVVLDEGPADPAGQPADPAEVTDGE